jgi:hypothetical protein
VSTTLELTAASREQIRELEALARKAEDGDAGAKRELRRAVKESASEAIARCSNIARDYRRIVADTAAGRDPLVKEAIVERARRMSLEITGESPTPLEGLLAERIASLWVLVEAQEALLFAWYSQENTSRRYLAAIKTLAQVRKLHANTPGVQFNTQVNVLR